MRLIGHLKKRIHFRNIGIASKISMFFSMLLICLLVIIGSVFLHQQNVLIQNVIETRKNQYEVMIQKRKNHVYQSLKVSVQAYNRIMAQSVLFSLYDLDPITAEYMLKVFMEPKWLMGIIVYDEMNQIFTSIWRGENDNLEFFSGVFPYQSQVDQYLVDLQDCIYKKHKIGQVKVIYTDAMVHKELEHLKQEAADQLMQDENMSRKKLFEVGMTQVIISFIGALFMLGIALVIGRSLTQPILRVSSCIHEMGKNNLLASLPEKDLKRGDEIGVIARGYETTRINLSTIISTFRQNSINLAEASESLKLDSSSLFEFSEDMSGDADGVVKNAEENGNYVTAIAESTSQISINVNNTNEKIAQLSTNIDTVATSASQASVNMSEITSNIEKISSDINTVNSSIETMSSNLATVSLNSSETVKISEAANKQINKSLDALTKLQKASDSIQSAVKIISTISTQTNLLALNATIEAVRGGDAGIRFGVVAEEVKNLAGKTANANNQIGKLLKEIRNHIDITFESIQETSQVIKKVLENNIYIGEAISRQSDASNAITMSVDSIAASAGESAERIKHANDGLKEIKTSASEVATVARESAINISEVAEGIGDIAKSSGAASGGISKLIADIRNIQYATYNITDVASAHKKNSEQLSQMAVNLKKAVSSFRIEQE
ncbi:MAG: hypothetical protein HQK75_01500 [Candidatus Magnetomorum sp.]|nr:hypothetical protein [Candidatus Magnetomorum sp.]